MERFFPEMRFENADFTVADCDTPQEAEDGVKAWVKSYIAGVKEEKAKIANSTIPPEANLTTPDDLVKEENKPDEIPF